MDDLRTRLQGMQDEELMELLDAVSEEVKRRNDLTGLGIPDVRSQSVEQNVAMVLEALADMGARVRVR